MQFSAYWNQVDIKIQNGGKLFQYVLNHIARRPQRTVPSQILLEFFAFIKISNHFASLCNFCITRNNEKETDLFHRKIVGPLYLKIETVQI